MMLCWSIRDTAVLPFVSTVLTPIPLYYHRLPSPVTSTNRNLMENNCANLLTNTNGSQGFRTRTVSKGSGRSTSLLHENDPWNRNEYQV